MFLSIPFIVDSRTRRHNVLALDIENLIHEFETITFIATYVAMDSSICECIITRDPSTSKKFLLYFRIFQMILSRSSFQLSHAMRIITKILISTNSLIPFIYRLLTDNTSTIVLLVDMLIENSSSTVSFRQHIFMMILNMRNQSISCSSHSTIWAPILSGALISLYFQGSRPPCKSILTRMFQSLENTVLLDYILYL